MPRVALKEMTTEELQSKLKDSRTLSRVILGISLLIIALWIVLGYWRSNLPVFISTVVMFVAILTTTFALRQGLIAELRKRQDV